MAGKSSNLGASASSSAGTKMVKQLEKRKQRASRAEEAKKPRPFQLINFTAHPRPRGSGTAVSGAVPLHRGASTNMATPTFPFPMTGVNGAAPLWSTAAALGAASRAAALTLSSLPAMASADGPAAAPVVIAPTPGLQPPPACAAASNAAAAALALPAASAATGVSPPLVLAHAGAGGHLVPLPLQFVGYHPTCLASAIDLPVPAVGIPLAAALDKIENGALGRMLSALMPVCNPPLRQHQSKSGPPPPWWPTGFEDWWATELLAHVGTVAALKDAPVPVPFAPSYSLKKAQKVAVLVAIVKHLAPDFARAAAAVRHSGKLSVSETDLWHSALNNERAKCMRPMFIVLPQQQGGIGGGSSAGTDPGAATGSVVVHSGTAGSDGCELLVSNLLAGASSVSAPADGSRGEVIAAAKLVEKEQRNDSDGVGVVSATDAPAGDGRDQPINFPEGGNGGSTHKQGAVGGGGSANTDPSAAGSVVVHSGNVASDGCELPVANILAGASSVSAPADGSRGEVIAAAEPVVEKEQLGDGVGIGVVSATDAPAGGDGSDQPVNFPVPGGDDGSTHEGAAVAAAPTTDHVHQVPAGGPEEMPMQQPAQDGGVPGDNVAAAAAKDEQVHPMVAPNADAVAAIEEEAPEDGQWWCECDSDELNRLLAEFELFGDDFWF